MRPRHPILPHVAPAPACAAVFARSTIEMRFESVLRRRSFEPWVTHERIEGVPALGLDAPDGSTRIAVADALGGLVMRLVVGGVDWLHRNRAMPLGPRLQDTALEGRRATAYVDRADVGLGDTCIVTVGGDRILLPDQRTVALPDHGFAWFQRPGAVKTEVFEHRGVPALFTAWGIEAPPFHFKLGRILSIGSKGDVIADWSMVNDGPSPIPWFWSSHDMLPLDERTEILLPEGEPLAIYAAHGFRPAPRKQQRWPRISLDGGGTIDLSRPARARRALGHDFALKLFTKSPGAALGVKRSTHELWIGGDATRAGLWINWGGWAPEIMKKRGIRYQNMCPERTIGGPTDKVSQALKRGFANWIERGGRRRWMMFYLPRSWDQFSAT